MKRFLSDNSKPIFKFFMTHLVMSILGLMVGLAIITFEGESTELSAIAVIGGLFTVGFMCFMHYDDMYFAGVKEGIRLRAEGEKLDIWKGLWISLVGYIPFLLVGITAIFVSLFGNDSFVVAYNFLQGSFLPWYKIRLTLGDIPYILITLLPALVSGTLGYALGLKDKTLRGLMGMKVKPPYDGPLERKPKDKNKN